MLKIVLDEGAFPIARAHSLDAGYDVKSPVDVIVPGNGNAVIDTGVHVAIPVGHVGMIKSKSGLNVNYDIQSEGVIDAGFTGSIKVKLYNHGKQDYLVSRGDKITQLVVLECVRDDVEIVDKLPDSERGANGFGSVGK
jgi:dUTP pyrophosphatase